MRYRCAHNPAGPARRAQTVGERARGAERDLLRAVDRLSMEGAAQGSAAEEHGAQLSRALELGRHLERIHHALYVAVREEEGHEASPTVAIIDSQIAATIFATVPISPQVTSRGVAVNVDTAQAITYGHARRVYRRMDRRDFRQTRRAVRRGAY
jgi:hypothetical protein